MNFAVAAGCPSSRAAPFLPDTPAATYYTTTRQRLHLSTAKRCADKAGHLRTLGLVAGGSERRCRGRLGGIQAQDGGSATRADRMGALVNGAGSEMAGVGEAGQVGSLVSVTRRRR